MWTRRPAMAFDLAPMPRYCPPSAGVVLDGLAEHPEPLARGHDDLLLVAGADHATDPAAHDLDGHPVGLGSRLGMPGELAVSELLGPPVLAGEGGGRGPAEHVALAGLRRPPPVQPGRVHPRCWGSARGTPREDWLVVTVDYHS